MPFTRTDNSKPVASTVVNENFNNVYDYYMGGDIGETIIKTNRPGLPRVLVVGDSFTNPLEGITHATASAESVFLNICFTCILCKVLYPCYSYTIYIISNHARSYKVRRQSVTMVKQPAGMLRLCYIPRMHISFR